MKKAARERKSPVKRSKKTPKKSKKKKSVKKGKDKDKEKERKNREKKNEEVKTLDLGKVNTSPGGGGGGARLHPGEIDNTDILLSAAEAAAVMRGGRGEVNVCVFVSC
jgi:hypothetical protein